jgi:peptidoglycan/LPS O-acetylase OafA/YrhL
MAGFVMKASVGQVEGNLAALDGCRALLAAWVLLGHCAHYSGINIYLISSPSLAVDVFMVMSGFFMVSSFSSLKSRAGNFPRATIAFYMARFSRVLPLYLAALVFYICFIDFWIDKQQLAKGVASVSTTALEFDLVWWVSRVTLMFGLWPDLASSTIYPDWSLSLEMQFYLVFPLIFLLFSRLHPLLMAAAVASMCIAARVYFGNYDSAGKLAHFTQPSLLPYRLNCFFAGMILAEICAHAKAAPKLWLFVRVAAAGIAVAPLGKTPLLIIFIFSMVVVFPSARVFSWLNARWLVFLGVISYGIYLLHMPLLILISAFLQGEEVGMARGDLRYFIVLALSTLISTAFLSYFAHHLIELPGIKFGKRLGAKMLSGGSNAF